MVKSRKKMAIIKTKKELKFYIMADRIMNGCTPKATLKEWLKVRFLCKERIIDYLKYMRKLNYYEHQKGVFNKLMAIYYKRKYNAIELQLRIHIDENTCGYGLVLPHAHCYRIGAKNTIGKYAVIQGEAFMTASNCTIGDFFYAAVGSIMIGPMTLGDGVSVAANSLVNKSCGSNVLLAGSPASVKKENYPLWIERDGGRWTEKVNRVERLKEEMQI